MRYRIAVLAVAALASTAGKGIAQSHTQSSCQTHACWQRVHEARRAHCGRTNCQWRHRFVALSGQGQAWARCVSARESGDRAVARESGFLSYFQWTEGTWLSAGGSGNPEDASWWEQAVRAWRWHLSHPYGQWPNTGEGGACGS